MCKDFGHDDRDYLNPNPSIKILFMIIKDYLNPIAIYNDLL